MSRSRSARVLLLYCVVAALMIGPHLVPLTHVSMQTLDWADAYVSMWSFWWTDHALSHLQNPYFTSWIFYPEGQSLAFHSYPLLYGLLSIPIQHLVAGRAGLAIAFNAVVYLSFVLSALGAYLLAHHVTRSRPAAAVAGLAYAFMPFHFLNSCRLAVLCIELVPFFVLAWLRLHERPSRRRALYVALWLGCTYYNSVEYALYLVLFCGLWLAHRALARDRTLDRKFLGCLVLAAGALSILVAPLLVQQIGVALREGDTVGNHLADAIEWSPALLSFVTPSRAHPLYGELLAFAGELGDGVTVGMRSETAISWVVLALALLSLVRFRRDGRLLWAVMAGVFFCLCLGPYLRLTGTWPTRIPLPFLGLYELLAPFRAIKEPGRMFPFVMLPLSLLAAIALRDLFERYGGRRSQVLALSALVAGLVLYEDLTAWPWQATRMERDVVSPFYSELAAMPGEFAIMDLTVSQASLLAQPIHGKRTAEWQAFVVRAQATRRSTPLLELDALLRGGAGQLMRLPADEQATRVAAYRRAIEDAGLRFILLPMPTVDADRSAVDVVARRLGATPSARDHMLVLELGNVR